jgi:4'-phosphopantetheinyl transferase
MRFLDENSVHVSWVTPGEVSPEMLLEKYPNVLSETEYSRITRLRFHAPRIQTTVSPLLLRHVLSRYYPVSPADWNFREGPFGKPYINQPQLSSPLFFNLSNTTDLVVCGVSQTEEIGVDCECLTRKVDYAVARRYYHPDERQYLEEAEDEKDHCVRFFSIWTLKEAYLKARGIGIRVPLRKFGFIMNGKIPQIHFDPDFEDSSEGWQFQLNNPTGNHMVATALRNKHNRPFNFYFIEESL